jgi:copper chaperone CopZ
VERLSSKDEDLGQCRGPISKKEYFMRKIAFLGLLMLVLAPLAAFAGDQGELPEGQARVALKVTGMSCGSCCTKVETAVAKMDGVVKVKADYEKGVAMVVYETEKVEVAKIVEAINTKTSFKAAAPKEESS